MGFRHRHGMVNTANYRCLGWPRGLVLLFCDWALSAMIQAGGFKPKVPASQDFRLCLSVSRYILGGKAVSKSECLSKGADLCLKAQP